MCQYQLEYKSSSGELKLTFGMNNHYNRIKLVWDRDKNFKDPMQ